MLQSCRCTRREPGAQKLAVPASHASLSVTEQMAVIVFSLFCLASGPTTHTTCQKYVNTLPCCTASLICHSHAHKVKSQKTVTVATSQGSHALTHKGKPCMWRRTVTLVYPANARAIYLFRLLATVGQKMRPSAFCSTFAYPAQRFLVVANGEHCI